MSERLSIPTTLLGNLEVSRFLIGGNPFSGFSHQSRERDQAMRVWYTDERIIEALFQAEALGLNACLSRGDDHIAALMRRYWDQGGTLRWLAQTNSRAETAAAGAQYCIDHGAAACYLHGGIMDNYIAQGRYDDVHRFVETVRAAGVPVGIAAHMPDCWRWCEKNVALDFYMGCYYNPSPRDEIPHHDPNARERYLEEDRKERVAAIQTLSKPVIHYKILAAGRIAAPEAFRYAAAHMRPQDAVCVGVFTQDDPAMVGTDLRLFLNALRTRG
jgi:hypothetical protein